MIVKSDKEYWQVHVIKGLCYIGILALFISEKNQIANIIALILGILFCIEYVLSIIVAQHILIMDENGCTYKLWNYQKRYKWGELKIKRFEKGIHENHYNECVFFSYKDVKKPKKMSPLTYCTFMHPFTSFFVFFIPEHLEGDKLRLPELQVVDKELFLKQLVVWGVEVEGNPYQV